MSHRTICKTCDEVYTCPGFAIDNHDGIPAVACSFCDVRGEQECGECMEAERCAWCGLPLGLADHDAEKCRIEEAASL